MIHIDYVCHTMTWEAYFAFTIGMNLIAVIIKKLVN
jgi:hypothetical protein